MSHDSDLHLGVASLGLFAYIQAYVLGINQWSFYSCTYHRHLICTIYVVFSTAALHWAKNTDTSKSSAMPMDLAINTILSLLNSINSYSMKSNVIHLSLGDPLHVVQDYSFVSQGHHVARLLLEEKVHKTYIFGKARYRRYGEMGRMLAQLLPKTTLAASKLFLVQILVALFPSVTSFVLDFGHVKKGI